MRTWKEVPHLFYNFELIDPNGDYWDVSDMMYCGEFNTKDCTLIARKIEDMTGEEKFKYSANNSLVGKLLYALSIRCLPDEFRKGFETGEVIDIKTL